MRSIYSVMLLCILEWVSAQTTLPISGTVTTQATKDPLAFATIGIEGSPFGTVSNPDGAFTFYIPSKYEEDSISISHVGFKTFKVSVREAMKQYQLNVALEERVILLEEVQVNVEKLTAKQIIEKALAKIEGNFQNEPFIMQGFFRDIRTQNNEAVYLAEAALDIKDPGYSLNKNIPKKIYLKGVRTSESRINSLLWTSYLNSRSSLSINLEYNYWLNRLKHLATKHDFSIDELVSKDDDYLYVIRTEQVVSMSDLAEKYQYMQYRLIHKYHVNAETYAIHKVEHIEIPIENKYTGIEPPYTGDTLFYCKKGWNQVNEFEEYQGKMYLKYHDASYAFDIVDEKNDQIFLDMAYRFSFIVTGIKPGKNVQPEGARLSRNRPLTLQGGNYDEAFWSNPSNAKLVPLTKKQIQDLEKVEPLDIQFRNKKTRLKRS